MQQYNDHCVRNPDEQIGSSVSHLRFDLRFDEQEPASNLLPSGAWRLGIGIALSFLLFDPVNLGVA